jgi:hypothetical protein
MLASCSLGWETEVRIQDCQRSQKLRGRNVRKEGVIGVGCDDA